MAMEKMNIATQTPIPLSKIIQARGLTIDIQFPAIRCYQTLEVASILTGIVSRKQTSQTSSS
jgi:hypothetical protein